MERGIKNILLQWFRRRVETPSESKKNDVEKTLKSKKTIRYDKIKIIRVNEKFH